MLDRLRRLLPARFGRSRPVIPLVRLSGAIGLGTGLRPGLTLGAVDGLLERAFASTKAPAVALAINSPGGSPVQADLIRQRIRDLATRKGKRVIAYVEDVAASGGYMIALGADEIVASPYSIVGSIGVVSAGFGLDRLIARHGIERRVHTAGTRKAILDPFRPEAEEDVAHLKALQADIHRRFIDLVRACRGGRLVEDEALFSGLFWTGSEALARGLVDRLGDAHGDLERLYGPEVTVKPVQPGGGFLRRRLFGADGAGLPPLVSADEAIQALEVRALWARAGL